MRPNITEDITTNAVQTPSAQASSKGDKPGPKARPGALWVRIAALGVLLLLGLALRLYHVTAPPYDFLSWRDTVTLMVARNFYEGEGNLFEPQVDFRVPEGAIDKGLVGGTELMVVPYLTSWMYCAFGTAHWVGRIVPIVFSLLGVLLFFLLVERFYGFPLAGTAALLLTVSPYYLYCGRCQMPESFAYAMSFGALLFYARWLDRPQWGRFVLAWLFALLMLLGKPHMGIMVVPMAYLTLARFGRRAFTDWRLYLFGLLVAAPFLLHLWWTHDVLAGQSEIALAGSWHFAHKRWLTDPAYYGKIAASIFLASITPVVFILAAAGLFVNGECKRTRLGAAWLVGALLLFVAIPGGAETNGYYQLILAAPMTMLAAKTLVFLGGRRSIFGYTGAGVLALAAVGYSLFNAYRMYAPTNVSDYHCGTWIHENTPDDALVLTSTPNTATLYFADRVGWTSWEKGRGPRPVFDLPLRYKHNR